MSTERYNNELINKFQDFLHDDLDYYKDTGAYITLSDLFREALRIVEKKEINHEELSFLLRYFSAIKDLSSQASQDGNLKALFVDTVIEKMRDEDTKGVLRQYGSVFLDGIE